MLTDAAAIAYFLSAIKFWGHLRLFYTLVSSKPSSLWYAKQSTLPINIFNIMPNYFNIINEIEIFVNFLRFSYFTDFSFAISFQFLDVISSTVFRSSRKLLISFIISICLFAFFDSTSTIKFLISF